MLFQFHYKLKLTLILFRFFYAKLKIFAHIKFSFMINPGLSENTSFYIPLKDFFKNPEKTNFQISPDGKYVTFLGPFKNRLNIFLQNLITGFIIKLTSETDRDIKTYFWGNDNTILFLMDDKGNENFNLYSLDLNGNNLRNLTPFENVSVNLIDQLRNIKSEVIIGMNKRNVEVFDAYRLNIETGELKLVAENPGNIAEWSTDHCGKVRIAIVLDGVNTSLLYRDNEDESFKVVQSTGFRDRISPLFFTFDNKFIYASSNIGRDKSAIVKFDIKNGVEKEIIYEHHDVDVFEMSFSFKRKVLTEIIFVTWKSFRKILDSELESLFSKIQIKIPDQEISITDMNSNEDMFIVKTSSDRTLGAYYLFDLVTDNLYKLSDVSPWIDESNMSEMNPITYTTRDGVSINGYLTLPKGKEPSNLPLVVNPHGGPYARDSWGYNPVVQFLANRGYAVLQMNFRGSTGYGREFLEKSFKQWGKNIQNDISDGVIYLVNKRIADPQKIAIYGISFGGYAALAGLAFTPELYAAGIDYVGISNIFTFLNSIPPYWKIGLEMFYEMVGDPVKDKELLTEASPLFHVDKIVAPLLVAQGKMDPRVNINESEQIVEALRSKGVDVEYIVKNNEGHGFQNEENKIEFYEAMEKFLDKHILKS